MNPPKYQRTYHWPSSPGVGSDDKVMSSTDDLIGHEIIITEKLDGGNTCLYNGNAYARSTGLPASDGWFAMVKKHHAWKTLGSDFHFYGEDLYGIHSIAYEAMKEDETFRLFHVHYEDTWFSWDDMTALASEYGFKHVPLLFRGTFETVEQLTKWLEQQSSLPSELGGVREGFVIRRACEFKDSQFPTYVGKWVRANHVQTDEHWRKNWKPCKLVK